MSALSEGASEPLPVQHPADEDITGAALIATAKCWAADTVDGHVVRSCWMVACHTAMQTATMWMLVKGDMPGVPAPMRAHFMVMVKAELHSGAWVASFTPEWLSPPTTSLPGWVSGVAGHMLKAGYSHVPAVQAWREEAKTNAAHKRNTYLGGQRGPGTVVVLGGESWVIVAGVGNNLRPTAWRAIRVEGIEQPSGGRALVPSLVRSKLVWRTLEMAEVGAHSVETKDRLPLHPDWPLYHARIVDNPTQFGS